MYELFHKALLFLAAGDGRNFIPVIEYHSAEISHSITVNPDGVIEAPADAFKMHGIGKLHLYRTSI